MKGYSPNMNVDSNKELNTQRAFIELGVNRVQHNLEYKCEKCSKESN